MIELVWREGGAPLKKRTDMVFSDYELVDLEE